MRSIKTAVPTVADVDIAIADLQGRVPEIERAAAAAANVTAEAQKIYEGLVYQKHLGDGVDDGVLARAFTNFKEAERREHDAGIALQRLHTEIHELTAARENAKRTDAQIALNKTWPEDKALCEKADALFNALDETLTSWLNISDRRSRLSQTAGRDLDVRPSDLARNIILNRFWIKLDLPEPASRVVERTTFVGAAAAYYRGLLHPKREEAA